MRYLSVCSGIEAASAAWMPLGWRPVAFSEIEPFPKSVLAHHHPGVPNWGDMTKFKEWPDVSIDLLCGGTPCQSFSVAGLRKGLADPRGNLMLTFGAIAAKYRPKWLVWENVPGVLSSNGGRDFGTFLGMLGQLGYGFAYRVLDAQYFGVAQRRRRVFVVGCLGDWRSAAAVLFERHSLQGHPAPRREAGQVAPTIPARSTAGGGLGTDFDCDGGVVQVCPTLRPAKQWPAEVSSTLDTTFGTKQGLEDQHVNAGCPLFVPVTTHTLRGEGFDASEDGTGRGTPLGPMFLHTNKGRPDGRRSAHTEMVSVKDIVETLTTDGHAQSAVAVPVAYGIRTANTSSNGWGIQEECTHTLDCAQGVAVAFSAKDYGGDAGSIAPTLRAMGHGDSHANGGGQVAVAFAIQAGALRTNPASGPDGVGVQADHAYTLEARAEVQAVASVRYGDHQQDTLHHEDGIMSTLPGGTNNNAGHYTTTVQAMQVRRLTPVECERLMGFPDGHTAIPHKGKPAADGPRYKALGNSWAVNCARWIGERIEAVEAA